MSGLDDTTEPAAQDAGQAQNQNESAEAVALPEEDTPGITEPSEAPDVTEQAAAPEPAPMAAPPAPEAAEDPMREPAPTEAQSVVVEAPEPEPAVEEAEPAVAEVPVPEPAVEQAEPVVAEVPVPEPVHAAPEQAEPVVAEAPVPEPVHAAPEQAEPQSAVATPDPEPAPQLQPQPQAQPEAQAVVGTPEPVADPAPTPAQPDSAAAAPTADASAAETVGAPQPPATPPGPAAPEVGATSDGTSIAPPPSGGPRPKAATETGKIVEGIVTAVSAESVELTLDDGRPAVIHRRNFGLNDEDPSAVLSVGDKAFGAELVREDPKSRVVLSRAWALKRRAWERVVQAAADNQLLSGKVVSASKKGLVIDVGVRGFVPSSHLELTTVTDMSPYVDQTLELKILEVDPRREKLVLSRRSLLLKAQRKEMQELLGSLKPGEVRSGTVASIADYGVFVDLGGVSGLVHISELSWRRVSKPSEVVSVGDQVEVKVLDVKPKKKRISLSMRQITQDPLAAIEVGAVVTGPVTRLVDFGAFVAIGEFEGLVHLSELAEYRVSTPEEIVAPGDEVGVKILSVDLKRRRIELSIRRAAEYEG